jgi:hypothetical protein
MDRLVVKRQGLDDSWATEYKNVQLGSPPAELFDIPSGYRRTLFSQDWGAKITSLKLAVGGIAAAKKQVC